MQSSMTTTPKRSTTSPSTSAQANRVRVRDQRVAVAVAIPLGDLIRSKIRKYGQLENYDCDGAFRKASLTCRWQRYQTIQTTRNTQQIDQTTLNSTFQVGTLAARAGESAMSRKSDINCATPFSESTQSTNEALLAQFCSMTRPAVQTILNSKKITAIQGKPKSSGKCAI